MTFYVGDIVRIIKDPTDRKGLIGTTSIVDRVEQNATSLNVMLNINGNFTWWVPSNILELETDPERINKYIGYMPDE